MRTLQGGITNTNPLLKNVSMLLRKNLGSFMQFSTVHQLSILIQYTKQVSATSLSQIIPPFTLLFGCLYTGLVIM